MSGEIINPDPIGCIGLCHIL